MFSKPSLEPGKSEPNKPPVDGVVLLNSPLLNKPVPDPTKGALLEPWLIMFENNDDSFVFFSSGLPIILLKRPTVTGFRIL